MGLDEKETRRPIIAEETTQVPTIVQHSTTIHDMELETEDEGSFYILIPFTAFLVIIVLSLLVYLMARNRRRIAHIYCKKRQGKRFAYDDDAYDSPLEQDPEAMHEEEDEVDNEDNPTKSLLRGKLQINNRYENYLSTSHLNKSSELFT
ncbi:uncharacterized protein LOC101898804 [Musca domestica]|uniref:Uncharacterized protein LOC101898804 n=1 Tax=Musca domestica TaxID=7370 RepID=A0A1I8M120_MUSDO|nr:uncharacterized protein LOC101898804 [Musca domestica]